MFLSFFLLFFTLLCSTFHIHYLQSKITFKMSEFAEIVEFVGFIVKWAFELTLNVICGGLLMVSAVFPWRVPEICFSARTYDPGQGWRQFCVKNIRITLFDVVAVPLGLFSLLSPVRWKQVYLSLFVGYKLSDIDSHYVLRSELISAFGGAVADAFCYSLGLVVLFSVLGRQRMVYKLSSAAMKRKYPELTAAGEYGTQLESVNIMMFHAAMSSLIDLVVLIPAIFSLVVVTTWPRLFAGLSKLRDECGAINALLIAPNDLKTYYYACDKWFVKLRRHLVLHVFHSLIDVLVFPFFLLALISPLRSSLLRRELATLGKLRSASIALDPECAANSVGRFEFAFSWAARERVVYHALSSMVDYLCVVPAVVAFCAPSTHFALRDGVSVMWTESVALNRMKVRKLLFCGAL
jgi:hypothetical protein